ncbi:MAG: hypothetical protein Ct9H300mP19_09420 [Dehalococcoidia bacterium]|nr:MAG: hypothetical protein Ct9H300mP19_09420 [Dehalococcoidia bacterium]
MISTRPRLDVVLAEKTKPLESRANIQRSIRAGLISIMVLKPHVLQLKLLGTNHPFKPPKDYLAPAITPVN